MQAQQPGLDRPNVEIFLSNGERPTADKSLWQICRVRSKYEVTMRSQSNAVLPALQLFERV